MTETATEYLLVKVNDQDLDAVVAQFRALHKAHAVAHAVAVGLLVVERFYHGDYSAARSRNPQSHARFRELIERRGDQLADLALPERTLQRCIAASDTWRALPDEVRSRLNVVHLAGLAAVVDPEKRQELAHDAATLRWTGEQVRLAVADQKTKARGGKAKPGRKEKPALLKAAVSARAALRKLAGPQAVAWSPNHQAELRAVLAEVHAIAGRWLGE